MPLVFNRKKHWAPDDFNGKRNSATWWQIIVRAVNTHVSQSLAHEILMENVCKKCSTWGKSIWFKRKYEQCKHKTLWTILNQSMHCMCEFSYGSTYKTLKYYIYIVIITSLGLNKESTSISVESVGSSLYFIIRRQMNSSIQIIYYHWNFHQKIYSKNSIYLTFYTYLQRYQTRNPSFSLHERLLLAGCESNPWQNIFIC